VSIIDVALSEESQTRYLTYALSVISGRALPDVRDGLKPVQRRILYAMVHNLHLNPDRYHRKSAAVVGEVLARYHPHGDAACYEAMVRMAQGFTFRYPLVDGQGNFGSLDGDAPAAYRYTEARLTKFALEVVGDIGEETIPVRENFDQTTKEPVVLPSRVPNLLVNGASGIAVGMATAIPPHNLREVVKALLLLIKDETVSDAKLLQALKGPDFPTGCSIHNTKEELREVYKTGRGVIRMRANYKVERGKRGKEQIVLTSVPYAIDKSAVIEKIADLIIARKIPQLIDVRDESTDVVRVVLELSPGADPEAAMVYLYKNTALQSNFNVNLTALIPTKNPYSSKPELLSLREMLIYFIEFRLQVTKAKLEFEKKVLEQRIHLLEGLVTIFDAIDKVIQIVRKSDGRSDAAANLQKHFTLTVEQALFIVDLRIYQLSKTSINEIQDELKKKAKRVKEINSILRSKQALNDTVSADLQRVANDYGDNRRSELVYDYIEPKYDVEAYLKHEDVYVVVTADGWVKRIGKGGDPSKTKLRDGDKLFYVKEAVTHDLLAVFTNFGNVFVIKVFDLSQTSGYGDPVQKLFRFKDGEQVVDCLLLEKNNSEETPEIILFSKKGYGFRLAANILTETKRNGKRLMRLAKDDSLKGVAYVEKKLAFFITMQGYGLCFLSRDIPSLSGAGKGVILQRMQEGDELAGGLTVSKSDVLKVALQGGKERDISVSSMTISNRANRGNKVVKRGGLVVGLISAVNHK
jgi:DNA gyrase subunit A